MPYSGELPDRGYEWGDTPYIGKHLKKLTHTGLPEERVAVLLVGATDEILLGVPKIDNVCIKFNLD